MIGLDQDPTPEMSSPISRVTATMSAASPPVQAAIISAACGVFGVVCGFVLYVVFSHMFEHGNVLAKGAGVAAGLIVSMAVAWTAERLWETIDSGEFRLQSHSRRAFVAGLSLVVVFELSASAFEDFARELTGDFDGIKRIAAAIAGRETSQADSPISAEEGKALLVRLQADAVELRNGTADVAASPGARLIEMMTERERLEVLYSQLSPDDVRISRLMSGYAIASVGRGLSVLTGPCHARPRFIRIEDLKAGTSAPTGPDARDLAACRNFLGSMTIDARVSRLVRAMTRVVDRHDLYDARSFTRDGLEGEAYLEPAVLARLQAQREACDAIRASTPAAGFLSCADAARKGVAVAGSGKLIPPSEMRMLNRDLLAASFPGIIRPLPVLWWDMAIMMVMWCTSAVVVGVSMSYLTRADSEGYGLKAVGYRLFVAFCALWISGLIAAGVLVLIRMPPHLWQLMWDPNSPMLVSAPGILNLIPGTVTWLSSGAALGFSVPGWITLPVLFATAFMMFVRSQSTSDDSLATISGLALLGLVLSAVAPVLDGLVGVVLLLVGAWFVPTFSLAMLAPYLRPGRDLPHWWGIIALLGGLAIAFWVGVVLQETDVTYRGFIACAGLVAASTGALILRRVPMIDLWPLLAITIGLSLVGLSAAFQQLTFAGALKHLHPVAHVEVPKGVALRSKDNEDLLGYLTILVPSSPESEALPEAFLAEPVPADDEVAASLHLELALAGSIGFWLTLSMMVGWALNQGPRRHDDEHHAAVAAQ